DRHIEPGLQANWRGDGKSLRVVFAITDEPYELTDAGEPAIAQVISALKAKKILVIGLRADPSKVAPADGDHTIVRQQVLQQQLVEIAQGSDALAPKGGVDCDGGGTPDIATGQPIVCPLDERGMRRTLQDTLVSVLT